MKQVKILHLLTSREIEDKINEWLKNNKDKKIVSIEKNYSPEQRETRYYWWDTYWDVMITYEPKKKLGFSVISFERRPHEQKGKFQKLENAIQQWRKSVGVDAEDITKIDMIGEYSGSRTNVTKGTLGAEPKKESVPFIRYDYLVTYLVEDTDG